MNSLSCLDNEVGIKDCAEYESSCGSYINSLPGVTLELTVGVTDAEKQTFYKLWEEIVSESKISFRLAFTKKMLECHELVLVKNGGCDYEKLICKNKKLLHESWKYQLAITLFEFAVFSNRTNRFTTVLKEQQKELLDMYREKFKTAIDTAIRFLPMDDESCCAPCAGNPKTMLYLP